MATIMSWRSSGGSRGRCDNHCHSAKHPKCVCCCGGRFHGSANQSGGIKQAVKNYWDSVLDEAEKKAKEEGLELETERWARNRQQILGKVPQSKKQRQQANQLPLPLEVA